jgi:uncharacterized SAM-binding protein YcdF (DUF218 family)
MLILTKAVGILLTPPGIIVVLAVLGLLLQRRSRFAGTVVVSVGIGLLYVLSLPVVGNALLGSLERSTVALPRIEDIRASADAIVVLGGGRDADQPQYGGDTVSKFTLERLRYAARLRRATGLPILVSGGSVFGAGVSEAELMRQALARDFQVTTDWVENRSRNTMENAIYSRPILEAARKNRVWLVTDAWHMPRALWAFRRAGIEAIMAPTGFNGGGTDTFLDFLPSSRGLHLSNLALHELLGILWYRLRYGRSAIETS